MTTYTDSKGREIVVCDGCGMDHTGKRADLFSLKAVDQSAAVQAFLLDKGFDEASLQGCGLTIRDTCPDCMTKGEGARV